MNIVIILVFVLTNEISAAPTESRRSCGNVDKSTSGPLTLQSKWSKSSLTWSIRSYPYSDEISEADTKVILKQAFKAWTDHIPLEIEEVCSTCNADIVINFESRAHCNGDSFDGEGGVLAHAFSPNDGRIHFDYSETWTENFDGSGINLYVVAVHEIGHALGLNHNDNRTSTMWEYYPFMGLSKVLPSIDIYSIQQLYGSKPDDSDDYVVYGAKRGGDGGGDFDDKTKLSLSSTDRCIGVEIRHVPGHSLESIRFIYTGNRFSSQHGQGGHQNTIRETFTLQSHERINEITVYIHEWDLIVGGNAKKVSLIHGIQFFTTEGRQSRVYGSTKGRESTASISEGYGLAYVRGKSGLLIDMLQFVWSKQK